ncbi:MAG: 1-phosphofructokinase [Deltaproteobacteria bacterium]|jgi:1-phosphofructokinase|nr:1-phosphofructokinase [Deltaproteobacteria bacterium]
MIYTVTFNPAIDYVVSMDELTPGSINRTKGEAVQLGGKGINVSTMLLTLGHRSVALGFIAGITGKLMEQGLKEAGIGHDFVHLDAGLTRINIKVKAKAETEINGRGPEVGEEALERLYRKAEHVRDGDCLVLAGNVPKGVPLEAYGSFLARLDSKKALTVVDATGDLMRGALRHGPFLVKPNKLELGELLGKKLGDEKDILEGAKALQGMGARNVLVSMAADGALLLDQTGAAWRIPGIPGEVKNSVGAGDSMVGGFLAGYLENFDFREALRLGAAAGTATAFSTVMAEKAFVEETLAKLPEPAAIQGGLPSKGKGTQPPQAS